MSAKVKPARSASTACRTSSLGGWSSDESAKPSSGMAASYRAPDGLNAAGARAGPAAPARRRVEEDVGDVRELRTQGLLDLVAREVVAEVDPRRDEQRVRADVHRQQLEQIVDPVVLEDRPAQPVAL